MCGLIFLAICLLSFSVYNLSASGDHRHLSFPFCKASLPRITLVILFPSLPLSSKLPFPKLVHSLNNKNSSSGTYHSKEASLIKTKLCQARPTKYNHGMSSGPDGCIIKGVDIKLCQARPKTNKNYYNVLQIVYKTTTQSSNYAAKSRLRRVPTHPVTHQDWLKQRECRSSLESNIIFNFVICSKSIIELIAIRYYVSCMLMLIKSRLRLSLRARYDNIMRKLYDLTSYSTLFYINIYVPQGLSHGKKTRLSITSSYLIRYMRIYQTNRLDCLSTDWLKQGKITKISCVTAVRNKVNHLHYLVYPVQTVLNVSGRGLVTGWTQLEPP